MLNVRDLGVSDTDTDSVCRKLCITFSGCGLKPHSHQNHSKSWGSTLHLRIWIFHSPCAQWSVTYEIPWKWGLCQINSSYLALSIIPGTRACTENIFWRTRVLRTEMWSEMQGLSMSLSRHDQSSVGWKLELPFPNKWSTMPVLEFWAFIDFLLSGASLCFKLHSKFVKFVKERRWVFLTLNYPQIHASLLNTDVLLVPRKKLLEFAFIKDCNAWNGILCKNFN